jgi:cytochrome P450
LRDTDTTAHTLSFTVGALAVNPNIFQLARQEVDRVWNNHSGINSKSFKEFTYLQGVIKESMRLYPVSNGSTECVANRDTVIEGIYLPKGTPVRWSIMAAGRDPEEYPQPNEFIPDRWLKDKNKDTSPLTFLFFGSGSHRCLGESLAILEATVMLAMLIRHFDWELVNGRSSLEQLGQNLTVFPQDQMPVKFKLREQILQTVTSVN